MYMHVHDLYFLQVAKQPRACMRVLNSRGAQMCIYIVHAINIHSII